MKKTIIIILLLVVITACGNRGKWQAVEYGSGELRCDSLHSVSAEGGVLECRPWIEGDTLVVHISALDLGWAAITLKIYGRMFRAELNGVPFHTTEIPLFETIHQRLHLDKEHYTQGDTLCARLDLLFRITYPDAGISDDRIFRGTICEVIRTKDFDPFAKENFMTFNLPTALHEMGEPLNRHLFDREQVSEFSIELLNEHFPQNPDILYEEVTWDISPTRSISDEGKERLTIWYIKREGQWIPIHYREWHTGTQF